MANLYNQAHQSMVFGEQGPENVVTDIHQVKQWAVNRYPQLPYFYDGSQHGVFRLAQLSARLSCNCARSHFSWALEQVRYL